MRTVSGQRSTVNGRRSTANGQRSTVNGQRSTVDGQRSTVDIPSSIGNFDRHICHYYSTLSIFVKLSHGLLTIILHSPPTSHSPEEKRQEPLDCSGHLCYNKEVDRPPLVERVLVERGLLERARPDCPCVHGCVCAVTLTINGKEVHHAFRQAYQPILSSLLPFAFLWRTGTFGH